MNKKKSLATAVPLNFLLGCSEKTLGSFELARLADVADLRGELHNTLDRLLDQMNQAALAAWFRKTDREILKKALENPDDVIVLAKEQIRDAQRSEEELIPLTSLPPGAAHLAAALRYQERQIAKGLCSLCPEPLAHNSVRFCEKHLTAVRLRHKPKNAKGEPPGSVNWLYQDENFESRHGRQPGTLAALEMSREKRTRALLAEFGVSPESAAVSLKAAKNALLKCMPATKAMAMTAPDLFRTALILSPTTGQRAMAELLSEGSVQYVGTLGKGNSPKYFAVPRG